MTDYVIAHYDWLIDNLQHYVTKTGGAGAVQFSAVTPERLATNILRSTVQAGGRVAGAAVTSQISKGASDALSGLKTFGSVLGNVTGIVISALWGIVDAYFEKGRVNKLVHAATSQMGAAMNSALVQAKGTRNMHLKEWRTLGAGFTSTIMKVNDVGALNALRGSFADLSLEAATGATRLRGDTSLYEELIDVWLMQTAKDEERGGKDVNPETYAAARRERKRIDKGQNWRKPRLFIEQCRYEWGKLGVEASPALAELEQIHDRYRGQDPKNIATLASKTFRFNQVASGTKMMVYLAEQNQVLPPREHQTKTMGAAGMEETTSIISHEPNARGSWRTKRILQSVLNGKVDIQCKLDVTQADGAVYVGEFAYNFSLTDPSGGQEILRIDTTP